MVYVNIDDIKKLIDNALGATSAVPDDNSLPIEFGILSSIENHYQEGFIMRCPEGNYDWCITEKIKEY